MQYITCIDRFRTFFFNSSLSNRVCLPDTWTLRNFSCNFWVLKTCFKNKFPAKQFTLDLALFYPSLTKPNNGPTHVRALSDSHCCRLYREIPTTVLVNCSIIGLLRLLWLYIYGINLSELTIARVTLVLIPCPISTPPWEMATVPSFLNTETEAWKLPYVSRGNFIGTKLIPLFFQTFALKNNVFHSL